MITLKELELFYKLCEDSHISNLAKKLNLTQSAISLSLNSLEKKLQEKLFDRVNKRLVLNDRGKLFYKQTYQSYHLLKNSCETFNKEKLKGELSVSSSKTFNSINLSNFIYKFIKEHEEVNISKYSKNTKQILEDLLNMKIDIGFVENDFYESNLIKQKLLDDELIIVTSDKSLENKELFIDELYYKKWILRELGSATREVFLNKLKNLDDFKITMEISNFEEIKSILLQNSETITSISKHAVKKELEEKKLFKVKTRNLDFKRALFMVYHKNRHQSRLFLEFKEHLKNSFSKDFHF